MEGDSNPILHVCVVGFHHKKGCQLEYIYPPLGEEHNADNSQLPEAWKHLPSMAIPDGAHNFDKDTIYFHLSALDGSSRTVFGISCYRQISASNLVNRTADVTRSTVQKSVCVLSNLPLYGLIQAKLELITHAYFDELDFSKVQLLEETYKNLSQSIGMTAFKGSQVFLGMSACDVVKKYRHSILVLFKLLLLERRVLFYMSPVEALNNIMLGVLSLFPNMIENGLTEAAGSTSRRFADDLQVQHYGSEEYLELQYVHDAPDIIKAHVPIPEMQSQRKPDTEGTSLRRQSSVSGPNENTWSSVERQISDDSSAVRTSERNNSREGSADRPDSLSNLPTATPSEELSSPVSSAATYVQPPKVVCEQPTATFSDEPTPSVKSENPATIYDPLADIEHLTHVERIQEKELNDDEAPLNISYKTDMSMYERKEMIELDSPESVHQIDQEDCFSWEEDRLLLEIEEELVKDNKSENVVDLKPETATTKKSSLEHQVVRDLKRSDSDSGISSCSSRQTDKQTGSYNTGSLGASGQFPRTPSPSQRLPDGVHPPAHAQSPSHDPAHAHSPSREHLQECLSLPLDTDECGFPLAMFTKGSICHPYLSLQYYSLLEDVNVRSFTIGATNILFKQKKLLTDAVIGDDESLIEIRDSELKKQLSLTTADLRFADYIVKNVVQESQDVFLDGTGWEGGEEWIRVQFKMYLMSLLVTCKHGDDSLEEDFGSHFVNALKTTHHYKVWLNDPNVRLGQFDPGHPFQGQVSISDMKLKWTTTMQNTGKGRKINAAVHQTGKAAVQAGKAVGGAFNSAKNWLTGWSKEKQ